MADRSSPNRTSLMKRYLRGCSLFPFGNLASLPWAFLFFASLLLSPVLLVCAILAFICWPLFLHAGMQRTLRLGVVQSWLREVLTERS